MVYLSSSALSLLILLTGLTVWQWSSVDVLNLLWWQICITLVTAGAAFVCRSYRHLLDWVQVGILLPCVGIFGASALVAYGWALQAVLDIPAAPWHMTFSNGMGWAVLSLGLVHLLESTQFYLSGALAFRAPWQLVQRVASRFLIPQLLAIVIVQALNGVEIVGALPALFALWFAADLHCQMLVAHKDRLIKSSWSATEPSITFGPFVARFADWDQMVESSKFHFLMHMMVLCGAGQRAQHIHAMAAQQASNRTVQASS
ncbi:MAG: hypothetical protein AAF541_07280 [Pseudomonadota bacterium]